MNKKEVCNFIKLPKSRHLKSGNFLGGAFYLLNC